jgi:hypothetical protein
MSNLNPLNYVYDNNRYIMSAPYILIDMNNINEDEVR